MLVGDTDNSSVPLEDMKFLEWKSNSSDDEGFKLVSNEKKREKEKRNSIILGQKLRGKTLSSF